MCGIAGIYHGDGKPVGPAALGRMGAALAHRGPDGEGTWADGGIGFAHRRLAILDLTDAARQPMGNDDGTIWITYNGEIYNFRELRQELEGRGFRFRSRSDTEVVLRAYEAYGEACLDRLEGMFAFALWDGRAGRLLLARDRFGIKPLYYASQGSTVAFASEVKALLAAGAVEPRVELGALKEYFTFQNVFSDRTLFAGVRLLPPGHVLRAEGGRVEVRRYWELVPEEAPGDEAALAREVREAFEAGVARHLVSDVPVGSYLSGGMDSGSIVAVASRYVPRLMTFTGGFDLSTASGLEASFDERAEAEAIASRCRTEHYEMVMHAGDLAHSLPRLVWHLEDLRVGMSYPNYYIARLASRFVKVVLAGTGGDELFGGYPWRYAVALDGPARDFPGRYYQYWCRLVGDGERATCFTPEVMAATAGDEPRGHFEAVLRETEGMPPVTRALAFEARTFLHGLLVVEDKLSMAHGLEVRVPFLDTALADRARRIPWTLKFAQGEGKRILRRAMAGLLPAEVVGRPKRGFSPPEGSWYRGESVDYIKEILLDSRTLGRGYLQPAFVRRVLDEHVAGKVNHRLLIWSLLCFEWWNRVFIDGLHREMSP